MTHWLTSMNKKRHQREINRLMRAINKNIENDDLWKGRFIIRQVHSPEWSRYEDGSGAELFVCLRCVDRCTGRSYEKWETVNHWRSFRGNGWHLWEFMNWFIVEHCGVWSEPLAKERAQNDAWREYNKNVRKV